VVAGGPSRPGTTAPQAAAKPAAMNMCNHRVYVAGVTSGARSADTGLW
jgi:hypothetical protein